MNDLLGSFFEDAESNVPEREKPEYTFTFFPEFIHSRIEFEPYRFYYEVPYEFRYRKEALCFKCNHDSFLNEDDNGLNYASDELFMEYRLNSLVKESKSNQYWFGYANYLKAIQRNDTTYINQLSSATYHNNEDFLNYVISVLHSGIGSKNLTRKDIELIWELAGCSESFKFEIQSSYNNGDENKRCEYKKLLSSIIKSLPEEIKDEYCQSVDDVIFTVEDIKTASTALNYYRDDLIEFIEKIKLPQQTVPETQQPADGQANQSTKPTKPPKTFESFFIKPEYETAFWNCLKEHERLTPQKTIIQYDNSTKYGDVIAIIEVLTERGYTNKIPLIERYIFAEKLMNEPCKPNTQVRSNKGASPDIKKKYHWCLLKNVNPN